MQSHRVVQRDRLRWLVVMHRYRYMCGDLTSAALSAYQMEGVSIVHVCVCECEREEAGVEFECEKNRKTITGGDRKSESMGVWMCIKE